MYDKVIVFGDSIAYGKWDSEGGWVARLRKYIDEKYNIGKGGNAHVYNYSIPGDYSTRLSKRLEFELKQTLIDPKEEINNLILIAVGVNDSCTNNWLSGKQSPEAEFKKAFTHMINISKKYKCEIAIIGLTPVDPSKLNELLFNNEDIKRYDNYVNEVCESEEIVKIELFDYLMDKNYLELLVDFIHPNSEGHKMIFEKVLDEIQTL